MSDHPPQTFGINPACLSAARAALRPLVVDDAALELLVPSIAQLLTELPSGDVVLMDDNGQPRFGRRGYYLGAIDAVREFRDESARHSDDDGGHWMVAALFRKDD